MSRWWRILCKTGMDQSGTVIAVTAKAVGRPAESHFTCSRSKELCVATKLSRWLFMTLFAAVCLCMMASAGTVAVTFTGTGGQVAGNAYIYPYYLNVNGSQVTAVCDDYSDDVSLNEKWYATVNTFSDLSKTLFSSQPDAQQKYQQAAWLLLQFASHPTDTAGIQYAIWDLFDSSAPGYGSGENSSSYWLQQAQNQNFSNFDFSSFVFYTPTAWWDPNTRQYDNLDLSSRPQEYIATPEPAAIVLFGSAALLLVLGMAWKRRHALNPPVL